MIESPTIQLERRILAEIETWIGTNYRYADRTRCDAGLGSGVDCLNFVGGVLEGVGAIERLPVRPYDQMFWRSGQDLIRDGIRDGIRALKAPFDLHAFAHESSRESVLSNYGLEVMDGLDPANRPRPGDILAITSLRRVSIPTHACFVWGCPADNLLIAQSTQGVGVKTGLLDPNSRIFERFRLVEII